MSTPAIANPTAKEVKQFGGLMLVFFAVLAAFAYWKPEALTRIAVVIGIAWLVSLVFNSENRAQQVIGILLPLLVGSAGLLAMRLEGGTAAAILIGIGVVIGAIVIGSNAIGTKIYHGWLAAALPIGWSISQVLMAVVYYLVVTPVGLVLRLSGRDSMGKKLDPDASTYWIERKPTTDTNRYFRQF